MPRSLRCPRCSTVVTVAEGQVPICPTCGFGGPVAGVPAAPPAAAPPASPPPAYGAPAAPPSYGAPAHDPWGQPGPQPGPQPGYGAPAWGMQQMPPQPRPRPGSVTFLAVLGFVGAGFAALAGLLFLAGGSILGNAIEQAARKQGHSVPPGTYGVVFAVLGVACLFAAALGIVLSLGLLHGRNWARITQLVFTFIGLPFALVSLALGNFTALVSLAIGVATLVILFSRDAREFFTQPRAA